MSCYPRKDNESQSVTIPVCNNCNSTSVGIQAELGWNVKTQKWESSSFGEQYCFTCGNQGSSVYRQIPSRLFVLEFLHEQGS